MRYCEVVFHKNQTKTYSYLTPFNDHCYLEPVMVETKNGIVPAFFFGYTNSPAYTASKKIVRRGHGDDGESTPEEDDTPSPDPSVVDMLIF